MLKGYCGKVLRVNLTTRTSSVEPLKEAEVTTLLGGRGIAAKYYYDEIGPGVDELGPENKIFFMTGPLTGTPLVSTTKFQLATKSPETRMYLCSNCGGDFGPQLKQAGFDGLIIEGKAAELTWLSLKDGTLEFHDASAVEGFHIGEDPQGHAGSVRGDQGRAPCPSGRRASCWCASPTSTWTSALSAAAAPAR